MSAKFRKTTVDPDEMAHYELSHLDLQCLQIQLLLCLALYGLTGCSDTIKMFLPKNIKFELKFQTYEG